MTKQVRKEYLTKIKSVSAAIAAKNREIQKLYQKRQKTRDGLAVTLRKEYENRGFVTDAKVVHKSGSEHKVLVLYYDNDMEDMALAVNPPIGGKSDKPRLVLPVRASEFRVKSSKSSR